MNAMVATFHYQIEEGLSTDDIIRRLPVEVEYNHIAQTFNLDEIEVSLDMAISAMTLYIKQNYTGLPISCTLPEWTKQHVDFEIDGEPGR